MSALDDFFGPARDETTDEAKCTYCGTSSKELDGKWTSPNTFVCKFHVSRYEADQKKHDAKTEERNRRVDEYIWWNDMQE